MQSKLGLSSSEFKRERLLELFKKLINNIKQNDKRFIVEKNCCERFVGAVPMGQNL